MKNKAKQNFETLEKYKKLERDNEKIKSIQKNIQKENIKNKQKGLSR